MGVYLDAPRWVYNTTLAIFLLFGSGFAIYMYRKYRKGVGAVVSGFLVGSIAAIVFFFSAAGA